MNIPVYATSAPLPLHHPACAQLSEQIRSGAFPRQISYKPSKPLGQCYWNVDEIVKEKGGRSVGGWLLSWWPQKYAEAMHHAVWETPTGELIDISHGNPGMPAGARTFVVDDTTPIDLENGVMPASLFIALSTDVQVLSHVTLLRQKTQADREFAIEKRRAGFRHGVAFHPGMVTPRLMQLFQELQALGQAVGASIDSLRANEIVVTRSKIASPARNDPCSCGSGKKFKKCCGAF